MLIEQVKKLPIQQRFLYWIKERQNIYNLKEAGEDKPWTDDVILQSYRFCNVYREQDRVTKWIRTNWLEPHYGEPDLWFACAVARWINWPDTLADIDYPIPWNWRYCASILKQRKANGDKVWTGAYMIGTQGNAKDKELFICENVLHPLWEARETIRPRLGDTLRSFGDRIVAVKNQGRFMVGQIIADIKYDPKSQFNYRGFGMCPDWWSFAMPGPGSARGINRLYECPEKYSRGMGPKLENEWHGLVLEQQQLINSLLKELRLPIKLHAQDVQNCLCEFDKMERVLWGEGKPRAGYKGK